MPKKAARHKARNAVTLQHVTKRQLERKDRRIAELRALKTERSERARAFRSGKAWLKLSRRKRHINPLCEVCEAKGKLVRAADAHHIVPVGADPMKAMKIENLISVCRRHHAKLEGLTRKGYDVLAIIEALRKRSADDE